jgi:hypothetical protein
MPLSEEARFVGLQSKSQFVLRFRADANTVAVMRSIEPRS